MGYTATPEQLAQWKKEHEEIFMAEVDGHRCYLKKPNRKTLSAAAVVGAKDPLKYNEIVLKNCWLGGDEEIQTDDRLFLGISGQLGEIIEVAEATIKKL
jgi:hypothetical protein